MIITPSKIELNTYLFFMFNYFKSMYEQKLQDTDFNMHIEQCKLKVQANNSCLGRSLGVYVSSYISLGTFFLGIIFGKYMLLSVVLAIFILFARIFTTLIMKQHSSNVDVWNTALIALDAACIEKAVK